MDQPQGQVLGAEKPKANTEVNNPSIEIELSGMQDAVIDTNSGPASAEQSETREDAILPDAQCEIEPPTPANKNAGSNFMLYNSRWRDCSEGASKFHPGFALEAFVNEFDASGPFQYTRDYTVPQAETPSEGTDSSGRQLRQYARIYTLAEKLGLPALKCLAHTKIHGLKGTPSDELVYARYIYTYTPKNDTTIRGPIASFWASCGHVLRYEVEEGWKKLCFEMPEFTYDVVTVVLDHPRTEKEKEKTGQLEAESSGRGSARKHPRSGV
ncbi:hypothetical protein N7448_003999 [Penicillium atrosanguineum]|nr:hypothetical protein N7448_003999 [Penicillium atrosanguineum]